MAASSTLRGRFVCTEHKNWQSFTDNKTGEVVDAGESLRVLIFTPHDKELCVVAPAKGQSVAESLAAFAGVEFGDAVEVVTGKFSYGKYAGIYQVDVLEDVDLASS